MFWPCKTKDKVRNVFTLKKRLEPFSHLLCKTETNLQKHKHVLHCKSLGKNIAKKKNRPWRLIGLWDIKVPTFCRQSAHRQPWGCQPYAPAILYPQNSLLISLVTLLPPQTQGCYSYLLKTIHTRSVRGETIYGLDSPGRQSLPDHTSSF
jgi:hypothetical protein